MIRKYRDVWNPIPPTQRSHRPCPEAPWGNLEKYTENGRKLSPIFLGLPKHWFTMHVVKDRNGGSLHKTELMIYPLSSQGFGNPPSHKKSRKSVSKFGAPKNFLRHTVTHPSSDSKMLKSDLWKSAHSPRSVRRSLNPAPSGLGPNFCLSEWAPALFVAPGTVLEKTISSSIPPIESRTPNTHSMATTSIGSEN